MICVFRGPMIRSFIRVGLFALLAALGTTALGCATEQPDDVADGDFALSQDDARYSARVVIPHYDESWADVSHGELAIEITASAGGFFGIGADESSSTGPLLMLDRDMYAVNGTLRIGKDLTIYMAFHSPRDPELYCCLGDRNPPLRDNGVYGGEPPRIADGDQSGFYVIGKLVGIDANDIRHGTPLRLDQIVLEDGMSLAYTRRIQRGDRFVSIELTQPPKLASAEPEVMTDLDAVGRR